MSQENVDRFRETVEAFNRMDISGSLRFMDPAIRFEHRLSELQGSPAGLESVKQFFADVVEHFDDLKVDCPDIRDLDDRVLALGTSRLTGKGSGVETELYDPEFENVPPRDCPESAALKGPEAVWDFYVEAQEPWEGTAFEIGELIDGGDKVVAKVLVQAPCLRAST